MGKYSHCQHLVTLTTATATDYASIMIYLLCKIVIYKWQSIEVVMLIPSFALDFNATNILFFFQFAFTFLRKSRMIVSHEKSDWDNFFHGDKLLFLFFHWIFENKNHSSVQHSCRASLNVRLSFAYPCRNKSCTEIACRIFKSTKRNIRLNIS